MTVFTEIKNSLKIETWEITEEWLREIETSLTISHRIEPFSNEDLIDSLPALIGGISNSLESPTGTSSLDVGSEMYELAHAFGKNRYALGFQIEDVVNACSVLKMMIASKIYRDDFLESKDIVEFDRRLAQAVNNILKAMISGYYQAGCSEHNELESKDKLTGFLNNKTIRKMIDVEIYRSKRYRRSFSLAVLKIDDHQNLDHFDSVVIKNQLLKEVASQVIKFIRASDLAARLSADEFTVLMPETSVDLAKEAIDRIRRSIKQESVRKNKLTTLSCGIAAYPDGGENKNELLRKGRKALSLAKKNGGNTTEISR